VTIYDIICPQAHLPRDCKLFTADGGPIYTCSDIAEGAPIVAVHPERFFIHNTIRRGHIRKLHRLRNDDNVPVELETLNLQPRVFRIKNFFSELDADQLIANALAFTGEDGLHRSITGPGGHSSVSSHRTSENVFDARSEVSLKLQRRAFELLGIYPFDGKMSDGLQILRYNIGQAYIHHMDYMDPSGGAATMHNTIINITWFMFIYIDTSHDYDSANEGSNRLATILLYLSEVELVRHYVCVYRNRHSDCIREAKLYSPTSVD
jgi:hypothetical protein